MHCIILRILGLNIFSFVSAVMDNLSTGAWLKDFIYFMKGVFA